VHRLDGCDQTGESEFSISPAAGTVMEEFLFFSQWKAGS